MKYILLLLNILFFIQCTTKSTGTTYDEYINPIEQKAQEAYQYVLQNGMNTEFAILIDMSIHSGKERFFVYNFNTKEIENQALVSHGCCNEPWGADYSKENPVFSNIPESHCSSLGKYKIGERGWSNWGIHTKYLLHGLEHTNSNALNRTIVFHAWEMVSDIEIYPQGTPEGWGCPAVSNNFMQEIDKKLQYATPAVLMWIYQ